MSKSLGLGVLVVGVGLLGWWTTRHEAHRIERFIAGHASTIAAQSKHGARAEVSGRDIHLTGVLDSAEEESALMTSLRDIPGRRVVRADVEILPKASPFALSVSKAGSLSASGSVPAVSLRDSLGLGAAAAGLTLASGAPEGWADLAIAGVKALESLNSGQMELVDDSLTIAGEARGPDEAAAAIAALEALPQDKVHSRFTLQDDGTPPAYTIDFDAKTGGKVSGKLPKGLDVGTIAMALGLAKLDGDVTQGILDPIGDASALQGLVGWLGNVETLRLTVSPDGNKAMAGVQGGTDTAALKAALEGAGFAAQIDTIAPEGQNGDRRSNAASGADQRFMGGYWLDVPQVDLTLDGCKTAADAVLAKGKITFLSGSDALDESAIAVINSLASVMARCAEEAGLRAEIGGHTDSTGEASANLGLSQRRAVVVRKELIARGVPGQALRAIGHGAALPIAENASEEGRAANRRTTIDWAK